MIDPLPQPSAAIPDAAHAAAERVRLAAAFSSGGAAYARLRPSYPGDLVQWLVGPPAEVAAPVADVGAGTGKLTEVLLALGHQVMAIEPSPNMLAELVTAHPGVTARIGTGEATGLADATVGAVCYAQAWHWVDPAAASAEAARILRPGGTLGLVWTYLASAHPGVAAVEAAMHALHDGPGEHDESFARVTGPFGDLDRREVSWSMPSTTAALAQLVTTRSYYLARPEGERTHLRRAVAQAVEGHFGPLGDTPIEVPYVTMAYRYRRE